MIITDESRCFISRQFRTIIDVIRPETGKTVYFSKVLDEVRENYPDAEEMTVGEFCDWKSAQQRTLIAWEETTEERFEEMLGMLPPAAWTKGYLAFLAEERFEEMLGMLPPAAWTKGYLAFLAGEPCDHDAGNGQPRYQGYRRNNGEYQVSSRPMTVAEFRIEVD